MRPREIAFHAYTSPEKRNINGNSLRLIQTDIEDIKELETVMFNAGFYEGFIDGKKYHLSKNDIYYFDRNPNEICFAQFLLTKDESFLRLIKKERLYTLCETRAKEVMFPTVRLKTGERAILTYTSKERIPAEMWEKYKNYKVVLATFPARCVVNNTYIAE